MRKLILPFLFCMLASFCKAQGYYLVTGTYTTGKSEGIYLFDFDSRQGTAKEVSHIKTANPSFLTVKGKDLIYAVNETEGKNGGGVSAFRLHNGQLTAINEQSSGGDDPCYISIDKTGQRAVVANYTGGSLEVLPVLKDGSLGKPDTLLKFSGHGPVKERQEAAHIHTTVIAPDNRHLLVTDLGADKLMLFDFHPETGKIKLVQTIDRPGGSGPRHLAFHPNGKWLYLVQELSGMVTEFSYTNGTLKQVASISALPAGFKEKFTSADLHVSPDGKFLYVSNRDASNTLAIFRLNPTNGNPELAGHQDVLGKTPRNFTIDPSGNFLLVANQRSDEVVIFRVDHKTGLLTDTGHRMTVGNPVCLQWIKK